MDTWPTTLQPNSMNWHLQFNTQTFESPFNHSINTHRFPGGMWTAQLSFKNLTRNQTNEMKAFVYSLSGANGRFLMSDPSAPGRPAMGTPVVAQSDQQGGLLLTSGWQPNTLVLKRGEYFSVNNELKMVMKDIWSTDMGLATLAFAPWLRTRPEQYDSIITLNPMGMFMLANDDQGEIQFKPLFGDISLDIREAFYV